MLTNVVSIKGFVIRANDGEIGTVNDFYLTTRDGQSAT